MSLTLLDMSRQQTLFIFEPCKQLRAPLPHPPKRFKVVQLDHTCLQVPWRLSATELNSSSLTSLKRICGVWYLDIKEIRFSKELPEGYKEISQTSKEVEICKKMQDTTKICHSVKLKCKKLESLSRWSSSFDYFGLTNAMIKSQSICKHRVVTALNSRAV